MAIQKGQRVRVAHAHSLRGKVVGIIDHGHAAEVRFDHHDALYPYHLSDLELEVMPCDCIYCRPDPRRRSGFQPR
jgi:hypothetical protein